MWAIGRHDLGLGEAEFWALTLPQLGALMKCRKQSQDREDFRAGLVASILCNANRAKGTSPAHPWDFFPGLKPKRARRQTTAEALAVMRMLFPAAPRKEE